MMHQNDIQPINDILDKCPSYSVLIERTRTWHYDCLRILNNREDAGGGTGCFCQRIAVCRHSGKTPGIPPGFRIVYNAAISRKRSKKPGFQSLEDLSSLKEHYDPLEQADDRDEDRALLLERAMQQLPAEDNVLITLFYIHESSVDEIHSITGLTRSNIKVRLFRARKKLQKIIGLMTEKICI
jgi:RNA polymerase sigma-70 factor (ECF subfamily)